MKKKVWWILVIMLTMLIAVIDRQVRAKHHQQFDQIMLGSSSSQIKSIMGYMYDDYPMDASQQLYLRSKLATKSIDGSADTVLHYKAGWIFPDRLVFFLKSDLLTKKVVVGDE